MSILQNIVNNEAAICFVYLHDIAVFYKIPTNHTNDTWSVLHQEGITLYLAK